MGRNLRKLLSFLAIPLLLVFFSASRTGAIPSMPPPAMNGSKHNDAIELLKKREYAQVVELEKRLSAEDPSDLTARFLLTIAYLGSDDEKSALDQAEQVRRIDPAFAGELYGAMGRYFITKNRFHKALVYFNESLKITEDPSVIRHIASIYLSQGLLKNAREYYEKLLSTEPDYLNLSRICLAEARYEKAIQYAKESLNNDPKSAGSYLVLGTAYLLTDKTDLAYAHFLVLKQISPEFFLTSYFLGLVKLIQKDYDSALLNFNNLISLTGLREGYINAALVYHLKGDLKKAEEAAVKAVNEDPLDQFAHAALGNIYVSMKDYGKADAEFRKASDIFPDFYLPSFSSEKYFKGADSSASLTLSIMYSRAGLYRQSVDAVNSLKGKDAVTPFHALIKARAEEKLGDTEKARKGLLAIAESHPELISPYLSLGDLYEAKKDFRSAITNYRRAAVAAPKIIKLHLKLADFYNQAEETGKAIEEYKKVITASPESVPVYHKLAVTLAKKKNEMNEALKYASRGSSLNPEDMEIKETLGWIYFRMGRYDEALVAYSSVIKKDSKNPLAYYHLGLIYRKMNNRREAIEALENALNINDEFPEAGEAKKMLRDLSGLG